MAFTGRKYDRSQQGKATASERVTGTVAWRAVGAGADAPQMPRRDRNVGWPRHLAGATRALDRVVAMPAPQRAADCATGGLDGRIAV